MQSFARTATTSVLFAVGAISAFAIVWSLAKPDYTHHEVTKIATALVLLALTAAYALLHRRRRLDWVGLMAFVASCAAFAYVLPAWLGGVYKGFAPADVGEANQAFWEGVATLLVIALSSTAAWFIAARRRGA